LVSRRRVTRILVLSILYLSALAGCSPEVRDRPPGYIRLAPVWELTRPETVVERSAVVVRYDERGFSVMSTLSTYDLSRLERKQVGEGWRWVSRYDESEFADDGTVLKGPAVAPLPYYELTVDRGSVESTQPDTLYVRLGSKRPPSYRFRPPEHLLKAPVQGTQGN
jgi:hypothetical protein